MNKAFTKEDDDAGFAPPGSTALTIPPGPFRLTQAGARALHQREDPRIREALGRAEILTPPQHAPERAALGVTVRVRTASDQQRAYRLVSPEEQALLGEGCSIESPIGRALLGAAVGDVRELRPPRGPEEVEIIGLEADS